MQIVDLTDVVQVTRGLVDIDSTTGREGDVVLWTATLLSQAGYEVVEQVVQGPRRNLYAAFGKADVVFSTHLDCVPPFFPSRLDGDTLHGRGSCDAKGAAASQIAALETLRREGITNVGLLLVVGEERGSDGAKTAHALASGSRYLVNGEPTDNRLGIGTRGILRVNLKASGRAAHSSFPELGDSAVVATVFPDDNKKYLSTALLDHEPVMPGYKTPDVELLSYEALKRVCYTCFEDE